MKKSILLLLMITVLGLYGCSQSNEMVDFIPTPIPSVTETTDSEQETDAEGSTEITEGGSTEVTEATPTPKELVIGETTTMYVKMNEYDDFLNVRATPSTDGEVVGMLVHTEKIEVIEIVDGWASIAVGNEVRYVSSDFLVLERPDFIPAPTPTPVPTKAPTKAPTNTPKPTKAPTKTPTLTPTPEALAPEI
ncbi:MAG: SH3 domain-containing protein [Mobilitalea sp.]